MDPFTVNVVIGIVGTIVFIILIVIGFSIYYVLDKKEHRDIVFQILRLKTLAKIDELKPNSTRVHPATNSVEDGRFFPSQHSSISGAIDNFNQSSQSPILTPGVSMMEMLAQSRLPAECIQAKSFLVALNDNVSPRNGNEIRLHESMSRHRRNRSESSFLFNQGMDKESSDLSSKSIRRKSCSDQHVPA